MALVSLALGLFELLRAGALHAVLEYDDGVWFGAALRLADGVWPYKDFVLDQPPGVPLLLSPVALLSHAFGTGAALATARVFTVAVEAVNVALVGWLVRHRSVTCVVVACTVAAVSPTAVVTSRTVMLEPYCAFWCLLGLVTAFDRGQLVGSARRLALAGVAFGVAGSCKAFAVLPFAVLIGQAWLARGDAGRGPEPWPSGPAASTRSGRLSGLVAGARRTALPLGAAVAAFLVVCSPFLVVAPGAFARQVVLAQLQREAPAMPSTWARVAQMLGVPPAPAMAGTPSEFERALVLVVGAFVVAGLVVAWAAAPRGDEARGSLNRYGVVATVVTAAGLAWPAAFYYHYAAFLAPFLALGLGSAAGELRRVTTGLLSPVVAPALSLTLLVVGAAHAVRSVQVVDAPYHPELALLARLVPAGACVTTDNPGELILANRFSAPPGCADMVDAYGSTLAWSHGHRGREAAAVPEAVARWQQVLGHTAYLVVTQGLSPGRIPWGRPLRAELSAGFRLVAEDRSVLVFARRQGAGSAGTVTGEHTAVASVSHEPLNH